MQEIGLNELKARALSLHRDGEVWHFHILTPGCRFNDTDMYAFILEDTTGSSRFVHYSETAASDLGTELAPLLHGKDVFSPDQTAGHTDEVEAICARAKALTQAGIHWHHHVLFPGCQYNTNGPRYTLVFEDPQTDGTLQSISDNEPKAALSVLEPLFYSQSS